VHAHLDKLVDVVVEIVVRELIAQENAVVPAKESDGVEDEHGQHQLRRQGRQQRGADADVDHDPRQ
jgi:hypothetical protein